MILLAPRNPDSYKTALRAYEYIEDASALRVLARRVAEADLDLSDDLREAKEEQSGVHEARDRATGPRSSSGKEPSSIERARTAIGQPSPARSIASWRNGSRRSP